MILKKHFVVVGTDGERHNELELEQMRNFREIIDDIARYVQMIYLRDFIVAFKWIDFRGLYRHLQNLRCMYGFFHVQDYL